jgi:hypothetical protein
MRKDTPPQKVAGKWWLTLDFCCPVHSSCTLFPLDGPFRRHRSGNSDAAKIIASRLGAILQRPILRPSPLTRSTVQIANEERPAGGVVNAVADILAVQSHRSRDRRGRKTHNRDVGESVAVHVPTRNVSLNPAILSFELDEFRRIWLDGNSVVEVDAEGALAGGPLANEQSMGIHLPPGGGSATSESHQERPGSTTSITRGHGRLLGGEHGTASDIDRYVTWLSLDRARCRGRGGVPRRT